LDEALDPDEDDPEGAEENGSLSAKINLGRNRIGGVIYRILVLKVDVHDVQGQREQRQPTGDLPVLWAEGAADGVVDDSERKHQQEHHDRDEVELRLFVNEVAGGVQGPVSAQAGERRDHQYVEKGGPDHGGDPQLKFAMEGRGDDCR